MTPSPAALPPWPSAAPTYGRVRLRGVRTSDVAMAMALSTDPYLTMISTLPSEADHAQALAWIARQQQRHAEGAGFSFTITAKDSADTHEDGYAAVGHCGLWLDELTRGRGRIGYSVVPAARGAGVAGDAVQALTTFAWTVPGLQRLEAHVEPWNVASLRTAERAGYRNEGLLRRHRSLGGIPRDVVLLAATRPGLTPARTPPPTARRR